MPKMEAIYEQESAFESSSIMVSQGRIAPSISDAAETTMKKFKYTPADGTFARDEEDDSDSSEEIDEVMEKEILLELNRQFSKS